MFGAPSNCGSDWIINLRQKTKKHHFTHICIHCCVLQLLKHDRTNVTGPTTRFKKVSSSQTSWPSEVHPPGSAGRRDGPSATWIVPNHCTTLFEQFDAEELGDSGLKERGGTRGVVTFRDMGPVKTSERGTWRTKKIQYFLGIKSPPLRFRVCIIKFGSWSVIQIILRRGSIF